MAKANTRAGRRDVARGLIEPFIEEWRARSRNDHAAFRDWATMQLLWEYGLSNEDVRDVTRIDGTRDKGIDGWFYRDDEAEPVLVVLQSKDTAAEIDDLLKLRHGFESLFTPQRASANNEAQERAAELERRHPDQLQIEFRLVTSDVAPPSFEGSLETLSSKYPTVHVFGRDYPCTYDIHDVERLAREIRVVDENPISFEFVIPEDDFFIFWSSNFKTLTATIPAEDIVQVFEEERTNLFRFNPRYYLSPQAKPNADMRKTLLSDDKSNFFIYNNGITAISETFTKPVKTPGQPGYVTIKAENFQIVNGCQTTVTLHSVGKKHSLAGVQVLLRIIETQSFRATAEEIARTSNTQNRMKESDMKSTDRLQQRLHGEFLTMKPAWYYEYKRGIWATNFKSKEAREPFVDGRLIRKVTKEDAAQAALAFLGKPAEAAESAGSIFAAADRYAAVFPETVRASQILLAHLVYLAADEFLSATKGDDRSSLGYLRYPMVACVSRAIHELCKLPEDEDGYLPYFPADATEQLLATLPAWSQHLLKMALPALIDELDTRSDEEKRAGAPPRLIGARSLVRRRDWWQDPYTQFRQRLHDRLVVEAEVSGTQEDKYGFTRDFPLEFTLPT